MELDNKREQFEFYTVDDTIFLVNSVEPKQLQEGEPAVNTLTGKIVEARDLANELGTLREATGYKIPKKRGR